MNIREELAKAFWGVEPQFQDGSWQFKLTPVDWEKLDTHQREYLLGQAQKINDTIIQPYLDQQIREAVEKERERVKNELEELAIENGIFYIRLSKAAWGDFWNPSREAPHE